MDSPAQWIRGGRKLCSHDGGKGSARFPQNKIAGCLAEWNDYLPGIQKESQKVEEYTSFDLRANKSYSNKKKQCYEN